MLLLPHTGSMENGHKRLTRGRERGTVLPPALIPKKTSPKAVEFYFWGNTHFCENLRVDSIAQ